METVKSVHEKLRKELSTYLKTQYFGKNNLLLNALSDRFDEQGIIWQAPYIELPAAYAQAANGLNDLQMPKWAIDFLKELADNRLGVFKNPYIHQIEALQHAFVNRDIFVSTGTGSGKTECFLWPLILKIANEAKTEPTLWNKTRGVRAIIMYPMNALVADQISRLRRIIGADSFVDAFRHATMQNARRPQFGMYTGRTPYAGEKPEHNADINLAKTLSRLLPSNGINQDIYNALLSDGKIPVKKDIGLFIENLKNNNHYTDADDAELITRFEMMSICPDILILQRQLKIIRIKISTSVVCYHSSPYAQDSTHPFLILRESLQ